MSSLRRLAGFVSAYWILCAASSAPASVIFVKWDAAGANDGTSWENAYTDLGAALDASGPGDEFWVAQGTYRPDRGSGDRERSLQVSEWRAFYGGFSGFETSRDERDWVANVTILSGDLLGDDQPDYVNRADNSALLLYVTSEQGALVSGFSLRGATYAAFHAFTYETGSGIFVDDCVFTDNDTAALFWVFYGEPVGVSRCWFESNRRGCLGLDRYTGAVDDCVFINNGAAGFGGGAIGASAGAIIRRCAFIHNLSARNLRYDGGGAIRASEVNVADSLFIDNEAAYGGAVRAYNSRLIGCVFAGNRARYSGGAVFIEGPFSYGDTLTDCLFVGNRATLAGGAIVADHDDESGSGDAGTLAVANCTIVANRAATCGGILVDDLAVATIDNSLIWQNADDGGIPEPAQVVRLPAADLAINYSCIQGWTGALGGVGNIGADPRFVDPLGPDGVAGTLDDDLRLRAGSPCIDAGDNAAVPADWFDLDGDGDTAEPTPLDLSRHARFRDDPLTADTGAGSPPIVDMGALEFRGVGDANCDGATDNGDIDAFVLALLDPAGYAVVHPGCDIERADANDDHVIDNADIDAFVRLLLVN